MQNNIPDDAASKDPKAAPAADRKKAFPFISEIFKANIFKNRIFEPSILRAVNRYLVMITFILALYIIIDIAFIKPYKHVDALLREEELASSAASPGIEKEAPASRRDYSQYSTPISGRKIFGQAAGETSGAPRVDVSSDISKDLGLVGIIPGDEPQAIIEDKRSQKTYYLNKGQSFDGFTVEDILENKVTLDHEGRKIALFL